MPKPDTGAFEWGERPLGYYEAVEATQHYASMKRHRRAHTRRKKSLHDGRGEQSDDVGAEVLSYPKRPLLQHIIPGGSSPPTAVDDSRDGTCELVDGTISNLQGRLQAVLARCSASRVAAGRSVAGVAKEVLLKRESSLPARFLPALRSEVCSERLKRHERLQQWWQQSIVDVADRVSKSMPLCRANAETQLPNVGSANAPVDVLTEEGPTTSTSALAVLRILHGHPAFQSTVLSTDHDKDHSRPTKADPSTVVLDICQKRQAMGS